ncbi:MAG TPA: hypothetical protein VGQ62_19030 [Chloroflexota bacterium]|jgi:hypothetical protein|nr:hypothetical protein [Chloroflexota bacterium]
MSNMKGRGSAPAPVATAYSRDADWLVEILTRAQDIVSEPAAWTRGALARSVLRDAVLPTSDVAITWSTSGALALGLHNVLGPAAAQSDRERLYDLAIRTLWTNLPEDHPRTSRMSLDIDGFNDYPGTRYDNIERLFERSVELARANAIRR